MSEPEGFLSRWSRRKREAESDSAAKPVAARHPAEEKGGAKRPEEPREARTEPSPPAAKSDEPFDLAKLPPIESITATTDIRPFLAPGVPPALTQAALRRAWLADPAVRNLVVPADYEWDFNLPAPGFDLSPPSDEMRQMLARVFGAEPRSESDSPPEPSPSVSTASREPDADMPASHRIVNEKPVRDASERVSDPLEPNVPRREAVVAEHNQSDAASQNENAKPEPEPGRARRGHGGAIPR